VYRPKTVTLSLAEREGIVVMWLQQIKMQNTFGSVGITVSIFAADIFIAHILSEEGGIA
jgi:hypothetical protein